jgi:hypothetical protein
MIHLFQNSVAFSALQYVPLVASAPVVPRSTIGQFQVPIKGVQLPKIPESSPPLHLFCRTAARTRPAHAALGVLVVVHRRGARLRGDLLLEDGRHLMQLLHLQ